MVFSCFYSGDARPQVNLHITCRFVRLPRQLHAPCAVFHRLAAGRVPHLSSGAAHKSRVRENAHLAQSKAVQLASLINSWHKEDETSFRRQRRRRAS